MSFIDELKRRNVFRVGVAYVILAWLLLQVSATLIPALLLPDWIHSAVALLLIIGFPLALFFAWAFELTPDGLKKEKDVDRSRSIAPVTGRKLDFVVIGLMTIALAYFIVDKFATDVSQPINETVATSVRPSIAVLPFVNMSSDPEQEYFSDGLTEEILNLLAKIPELKVIGRTSSFAFKGKNEDLRVIGEKLGVNTVLEGSVRKSGDRVRITAQLIDVADGSHIWSDSYDRTMSDIFAVQDDVSAAIIDALQIHIGENPTRGRPTDNSEAYAMFLQARVLLDDNQIEQVEKLLLAAIGIDPDFAEAYELMARTHWSNSEQQQAQEAAAKALAINPDLVLAQALYQSAKIGSHLAGIEAFEQALRKQPNKPLLLQALSWNLVQAGYFREALGLVKRWVEVDPLSAWAHDYLEFSLHYAGHAGEAAAALKISTQLSGSEHFLRRGLRSLQVGQDEQAIAYFEASFRKTGDADTSWVRDVITHARDPASGQAYLDKQIPENSPRRWYLAFGFIDRYFEFILENDPNDARWTAADIYLYHGITAYDTGFTSHPKFLEVAETMGLIKIWEKRGPPDICDKVDDQWVCQ